MQTLDQLLDTIGREPETEKTASVGDLVGRLRKEAADESPVDVRAAAQAELVEKTAEIGVIALTLAEMEQAGSPGIKLAAPAASPSGRHRRLAVFIKSALERGHSTAEVAGVLRKQAGFGDAAGDVVAALKSKIAPAAAKAKALAGEGVALAKKHPVAAMATAGAAGLGVGRGLSRRPKKEAPEAA